MSTDTAQLDAYRAEARAWLEANISRRSGPALRAAHDTTPEELAQQRALQRKVYEAGYAGITLPAEYGGQGLSSAHQRVWQERSEEHTSELQSLMRTSYAVFCLK